MAQTGFTPIQLYRSTTGGAVPVTGNLAPGELAINIANTDMALFAENASGTVVRLMNNPAGLRYPTADGTNGQVLTTNGSGSLSFSSPGASSLAGQTDTASPFETALGHQAGNVNTGTNNTFIGYQAGLVNSTGGDNTAIGRAALVANTTGGFNTVVGMNALSTNTTGGSNVAIGPNALAANTTGSQSVAIGDLALGLGNNGTSVAVGTQAGRLSGGVTGLVAIGNAAVRGTSAVRSVGIGANSLGGNANSSNTSDCVAVGWVALGVNTTGTRNTAVGASSLASNTTGENNVAVGASALINSTTSSNNVAVGDQALLNNTTGASNTSIGRFALRSSTTAANNTGIGSSVMFSNQVGENNVAIGYEAFYTGTASDNVVIGSSAGFSITTGTQNTLLGRRAGASGTNDLTTGSNNIIIGNNAAASSATVSNEVTLGNTSITSTRLRGMVELNAAMFEAATITATAATGTINYDARSQSVLFYTANASGNWTLNIRAAAGVSLDSVMTTGESMTVAFLVTNGATAFYQTGFQVDGTAITPRWQGGTAPTAGNASSIDVYVITVIKTAAATFTALASQTCFA